MVEFLDTARNELISYHLDAKTQRWLDKKVKIGLDKKDKDYVLLVDGYEGSGKSTIAQQVGKYVDPSLDLSRICMSPEEFKHAINSAGKKQCVIYDEAATGMTAGDSISKIGKLLKSLMMQMRQQNLFVIIVLPTVFEFNKYAVLHRQRGLIHTYELHGQRGYYVCYNRKDTRRLYLAGKKTYSYKIKSRMNGRFFGKYVVDEEAYRKKKKDALSEEDEEKRSNKEIKYMAQRDYLIRYIHNKLLLSAVRMENEFKTMPNALKKTSYIEICAEKVGNDLQPPAKNII